MKETSANLSWEEEEDLIKDDIIMYEVFYNFASGFVNNDDSWNTVQSRRKKIMLQSLIPNQKYIAKIRVSFFMRLQFFSLAFFSCQ